MVVQLLLPDERRIFIERDASIAVACPDGCVRGSVYFDSNEVAAWLRMSGRESTLEQLGRRLRCSACGKRPATLRHITKLHTTKLASLPASIRAKTKFGTS